MNVICPHGIVPCTECRVKFNRYNNIDNNLIVDRLIELEQHKIRQIDENRAVSKSLDEIRSDIEQLKSSKSNVSVYADVILRFCNLEKEIDNLKKTVNYNAYITNERLNVHKEEKPYICPVCRGSGRYKLATAQCDSDTRDCHACKGTGIVWG